MEYRQRERDLLNRARGGDREAFDRVAHEHRTRLEQLVRRRVGRKLLQSCSIDDICQETFLRAFRSMVDFHPQHEGAFFSWIASISSHVIHEYARRGSRGPNAILESDEPCAPLQSPSRALRRAERLDRLQLALDRLQPDHREVIQLVRFEKLSCREAGSRMGRSEVATRSLLWRALRALKDEFGDTESLTLPRDATPPQTEPL